jgi:hypothetical protein
MSEKIDKNSPNNETLLKEENKEDSLPIKISLSLINTIYNNSLKNDYFKKIQLQKKSIYTSKFPPKISIGDFIRRIIRYGKVNQSTLICALIYLKRICKKKDIILTDYNTHRLFFTAILIAIKLNEDNFKSNQFFSKLCGIKLKDLNSMEYNFMVDLSFDLFIHKSIFKCLEKNLLLA